MVTQGEKTFQFSNSAIKYFEIQGKLNRKKAITKPQVSQMLLGLRTLNGNNTGIVPGTIPLITQQIEKELAENAGYVEYMKTIKQFNNEVQQFETYKSENPSYIVPAKASTLRYKKYTNQQQFGQPGGTPPSPPTAFETAVNSSTPAPAPAPAPAPSGAGAGAGAGSVRQEVDRKEKGKAAKEKKRKETEERATRTRQNMMDGMSKRISREQQRESEMRGREAAEAEEGKVEEEEDEMEMAQQLDETYGFINEIYDDEATNEIQNRYLQMTDEEMDAALREMEASISRADNSHAMYAIYDAMRRNASDGDPFGFHSDAGHEFFQRFANEPDSPPPAFAPIGQPDPAAGGPSGQLGQPVGMPAPGDAAGMAGMAAMGRAAPPAAPGPSMSITRRNPRGDPPMDIPGTDFQKETGTDSSQDMADGGICRPQGPNTGGNSSIEELRMMITNLHKVYDQYVPQVKAMQAESMKAMKSTDLSTVLKHWLELEDALKLFYYVPPQFPPAAAPAALPGGMQSAVLVSAESFLDAYMMRNGGGGGGPGGGPGPGGGGGGGGGGPATQAVDASQLPAAGEKTGSRMHQTDAAGRVAHTTSGKVTLPFSGTIENSGISAFNRRGVVQLMPPGPAKLTGDVDDQDQPVSRIGNALTFRQDFGNPQLPVTTKNVQTAPGNPQYGGRADTAIATPGLRNDNRTGGLLLGGGAGQVVDRYPGIRIR